MRQDELVQFVAAGFPIGQITAENFHESVVVATFDQMGKFVNDNVLHTLDWFLRQLKIEKDSAG